MTSPPTDTYLAPLRPTGEGSTLTTSITQVGATAAANTASSTVPFLAPIGTANGVVYSGLPAVQTTAQNTLSPGAIAGIVIGVLLGLGLLLTLCFCFCVGEACIGIFGRKDKKKTTVVEEKYTHRSSRRRQGGDDHSDGSRSTTSTESVKPKRTAVFTRFFKSTTRRRTDRDDDRREDGGGGGGGFSKFKQAAGTAAGLATFATVLGVSRKSNKKELIKETVIKETEIRRAPSRSGAGGGAVGAGRGAAGGRGGARGGGGRGRGARSEYTERSDDFSTLSPESESSHGIPNPPRWRDEEIRPPRSSSRR